MKVLLISTWFPYPPTQGSKTRAYHLLRSLASQHEVKLLSFEDVPVRPEWHEHLMAYCRGVEVVPRAPFARSLRGRIRGWLSPEPSAVVGGYSPEMDEAAQAATRAWKPDTVVALTFVAAPYALRVDTARRVLDLDNLTAEMLADEGTLARSPLRRLRLRMASQKFARYEARLCQAFDLALVTSRRDSARLHARTDLPAARIGVVPNGVDLNHFLPGNEPIDPSRLVFTGAVTYEPNFDAVQFFAREILPSIRAEVPEATLSVTGGTEGAAVDGLARIDGVHFTGFVEDLRPMVRTCAACVVPLRRGGGTRLKVLEAMALGTPVVSTAKGAEGLELESGRELLVEDSPDRFARAALRLMKNPRLRAEVAERALERVRREYGWEQIGGRFLGQLEEVRNARLVTQ